MLGLLDRATKLTSSQRENVKYFDRTQTAGFWTIVTNKDASVRVGSNSEVGESSREVRLALASGHDLAVHLED